MNQTTELRIIELATKLRFKSLKMAFEAGKNGAHLGGGLSLVEVFATLYGGIASVDSKSPDKETRDRIIVSKGHCVLPYYSVLNELGFISDEELAGFETNGAPLYGHATRNLSFGIEFSGGSLGLGLSYAIGVALACKIGNRKNRIYVIVGDGECNEGIVWEALMSATHFSLDNLTVIIDHNKLQYDGNVAAIMNMASYKEKLEAFGFHVIDVDGHNIVELYEAFQNNISGKPSAIIANTIKGKGVSFMENKKEWHFSTLTQEQYNQAISEQVNK
ncbi:MAG TPA: transketolase [Bacteroidales bacterium]|nr:transketolase [Bacteroidales bacterium]HQP14608.1 transketolase [Bacteroidales bacterium]